MEGIIAVVILLFVVNLLGKGLKAANQSGPQRRPPAGPPLTPVARPGSARTPDWAEVMTMLNGQPAQQSAAGGSTSGSITGSSMMDGSQSMMEGSGMMEGSRSMMEGSQPMMDEGGPDYEGQTLPGEPSADAVAMLPKTETAISPPMQNAFRPKKFDPDAMRDAVVWAEILAKPKALRLGRRAAR
mgnify:CR=1 FL=1